MAVLVSNQNKAATKADVGKKVLVYQKVGDVPIEGIIKSVDELTGLIIEVIVKDPNTLEKVLQTKTKIVTLLLEVPKWVQWLINLFKKVKS